MSISTVIANELLSDLKANDYANNNKRFTEKFTLFNGKNIPVISIAEYIKRLKMYINCDNEIFFAALIYLRRILRKNESFILTPYNIHRHSRS